MMTGPFGPQGPTYLVDNTTAVKITGRSFRIRNLSATAQYIGYGSTPPAPVVAPSAGSPSSVFGLLPTSVEIFEIGGGSVYFLADNATGFEVTPGEGM